MLEDNLCEIGLTKNESKVYLVLLKIGAQAVSTIAKKSGLKRTSTYSILKSLMNKGFVGTYIKNKVNYYSPNDPNCLIAFIDKKCRTFDYYRNQMISMIPKFRQLLSGYSFKKPVVSFYDGLEGVRYAMFDPLNESDSVFSIMNFSKNDLIKDFIYNCFDVCKSREKFIFRGIISNLKQNIVSFPKVFSELPNVCLLDFSTFPIDEKSENCINIYDDKVVMINLEYGCEYAVILESKEIAVTQKAVFEILFNVK